MSNDNADDGDKTIKPDNEAAKKFLRQWCPSGPWVLTAIQVDKKGIETRTFYPKNEEQLNQWLTSHNGERNIYFHVNTPTRDLDKKANREDIKSVNWLHVDIDPEAGQDLEQERERCLSLLRQKIPNGVPKPTCIIFSGGGFQAFWKLKQPIEINGDLAEAEDAALYNKQLETVFGADNCHNIDRIMRLPGTVNIPDARKRKKGRKSELARVLKFNTNTYSIEEFSKTPPTQTSAKVDVTVEISTNVPRISDLGRLDEWNVSERVKVIIAQGHHPDQQKEGDNSRSAWVFDCTCHLVRCGVPDEIIYGILTDPHWAISESVLECKAKAREYATRQIERAKESVTISAQEFDMDKNGKVLASQHNIILAIKKLGVTLSYNEFADRLLIEGLPDFGPHLSDAAMSRMYLEIEARFGLKAGKDFFWMVAEDLARRNKFHPVKDFLDTLEWDGVKRLDNWLVTYGGAEDSEFVRTVGKILLMAAVRRIREPGCKFDEMLILEGPQGCGKSSALRILAIDEDWFIDDLPLDRDSKKNIEGLSGHWIVEAGELKGMRNGEVENLKAFLSRGVDKARMAYERLSKTAPRQCIIVGTTNNERYLKDSTGNRRFWPVKVKAFNLEALRSDINQLWAEACHYEAKGESIRLDPKYYYTAHEAQEKRLVEDPYFETLGEFLRDQKGKIRMHDLWEILELSPDKRTQHHNSRLGEAMQKLGWQKTKLRFGGDNPENCYAKGTPEERRNTIEVNPKWPEKTLNVPAFPRSS